MTSQINPNNIDGNYPVAGVPNNTQGMRDNFTNTKTNFQFAADEISELQTKSVLKAALAGGTLDNNMNDNLIYAVKLQDVSYALINLPATSGSVTIDYAAGLFQQLFLTGPVSLAFTNFPPAGSVGSMRVAFNITNVSQTVTLPAAVSVGLYGLEGVSPGTPGATNTITFGVVGNYAFEFVSPDGGTTIWIFDQSRPYVDFTSAVSIEDSTASTNTVTGALVVDGGVGIGGNLYVGGEIVGNIVVAGVNVTGNVQAGNVLANVAVIATGNVTGGNILTAGAVSATGNLTVGNVNAVGLSLTGNVLSALAVTGNVTSGNLLTPGISSAAGNVTGGNLRTIGVMSATGNVTGGNITTAGLISAGGTLAAGNTAVTGTFSVSGNVLGNLVTYTGSMQVGNAAGGIGYINGAGGTVSQVGNKSASVTLNNICGEITMDGALLGGDSTVDFTMDNSSVTSTDVMILNQVGGGNIGFYSFNAVCNSGNAEIYVHNMTNNNRSDAIVIRFAVIKAAVI